MPANVLLAPANPLRVCSHFRKGPIPRGYKSRSLILAVAQPSTATPSGTDASLRKNVVVVGGGWAGKVTLEDSLNRPRKGCVVASASDSTA